MEVETAPASGDAEIDSLADRRWVGTGLTFGFPHLAGQFTGYTEGEPFANFEPLNSLQQTAGRAALASISSFTNLIFTEISGGAEGTAVLRFGMTDEPESSLAHAYYPSSTESGGDSWYSNIDGETDSPIRGNDAWHTFLHAIGHSLGLDHPHESTPAMAAERDVMQYTVMSYRSTVDGSLGYRSETWGFAQTYMIEDIASLQFLYGANFNHNNTSSVYQWNPTTGEMTINGVGQGAPGANRVFMTVWDGGGVDTYDFSNYNSAIGVNLEPGQWVYLPQEQRANTGGHPGSTPNIGNPLLYNGNTQSLIENVIGTPFLDNIRGNSGNNTFYDNGGGDNLYGGLGDDTYHVHNGTVVYDYAGEGTDTVYSYGSHFHPVFAELEYIYLVGTQQQNARGSAGANTIIGNAHFNDIYGEGGDDTLIGGLGRDWLGGGPGADRFVYLSPQDSTATEMDTIWEFQSGVDFVDLLAFETTGSSLQVVGSPSSPYGEYYTRATFSTNSGTSLVIKFVGNVAASDFRLYIARPAAGEDAGLAPPNDIDGNGHSDVLWRNDNGGLTAWNGLSNGFEATSLNTHVTTDWKIVETGDFDGNGRSDILWRSDSGTLTAWLSVESGYLSSSFQSQVSANWKVAGAGDFDGDGRDDILWRNDNGVVTQWLARGPGFDGAGQPSLNVGADWKIASIGDFDGDGRDDILWRNDDGRVTQWLGVGNGFNGAGQPTLSVSNAWKVAGTGDFDGDGRDDILWRHDDGRVTQWLGSGNGFNGAGQPTLSVSNDWHVGGVGDFSGDGRDDILWRNDNGAVTQWLGVGTGFDGAGQPVYFVGNEWDLIV